MLAGQLLMGSPGPEIRSATFLVTTGAALHLGPPSSRMGRGRNGNRVRETRGHADGGFVVFGRILAGIDGAECALGPRRAVVVASGMLSE